MKNALRRFRLRAILLPRYHLNSGIAPGALAPLTRATRRRYVSSRRVLRADLPRRFTGTFTSRPFSAICILISDGKLWKNFRGKIVSGEARSAEHNGDIWSREATTHGAILAGKNKRLLLGISICAYSCSSSQWHDFSRLSALCQHRAGGKKPVANTKALWYTFSRGTDTAHYENGG